ncbi:MAG TPA: hypothetical protein VHG88_03070 [Burkholderiales bacterium]|nr:hypothetical protein [Burkholderiales bacterium]
MRLFLAVALLCASQAAVAGACGARIDRGLAERLTDELQQGLFGLAAYGESLASRPEANRVEHLVQQLIILHERLGRTVMLAEIRDAMRHEGEKSLVQFKLSHEASLLKQISSRTQSSLSETLEGRAGIEEGVARLKDAIARTHALFAMCDSPM